MAHPYSSAREHGVSRSRVGKIMKSGGTPHSDVAADKKLFKELMAKHEKSEMHAEGEKRGGRLDKFARGGRTKGKHSTQVNIAVVAPHGRHPADEAAAPGGSAPLPPPPRPGIGGPPGGLPPGLPPGGLAGGPPGLPPGMPPGMPPRPPGMMKRGGKVGMTAGAITGKGRKQKIKAYGLKPKGQKG